MWQIGQIAFANPIALSALVILPAIWWLLRVTPPAPKRARFPALRLLLGLDPSEQTAAHLPWWLMVLRLGIGAIAIIAFAEPRLHPEAISMFRGPLIAVIDDTAYAAPDWNERVRWLDEKLSAADSAGRSVMLLPTAETLERQPPELQAAGSARARLRVLTPKPWRADRGAAARRIEAANPPHPAEILWLCDGIEDDGRAELERTLGTLGTVTVAGDWRRGAMGLALAPPGQDGRIALKLMRSQVGETGAAELRIIGEGGLVLEQRPVQFANGDAAADIDLNLPAELANRIQRIEVAGSASAASVALWDDRFRRRAIGLVSGGSFEAAQYLLSDLFYLERALKPYAEVSSGALGDLLDRNLSAIILADVGQIPSDDQARLTRFVELGGLLLRFAGPKLAAAAEAKSSDPSLPVALRAGDRALGGALTWEHALTLAPFDADSPFAGLAVPAEVTVSRQVLAEPGGDPNVKTWARLEDGTPLVSALRRGQGWLVLVHVTATPDWSNFALSGLYVDMLRRLAGISRISSAAGPATDPSGSLKPMAALDGFGALGAPPASAEPIDASALESLAAGPHHPPGLYGEDSKRRAVNLMKARDGLTAMAMPDGAASVSLAPTPERDLMPALLIGALVLALIDQIATLALSGRLRFRTRTASLIVIALASAAMLEPSPARAAQVSPSAAVSDPRLAYVLTGDSAVDMMSKSGLRGLSDVLSRRTAFEPADPAAIDIERDDIVFYPVLYWPMSPGEPALSDAAAAKVDFYMKSGGLIVFDTRDQSAVDPRGAPGRAQLRVILSKLDVPPLARVSPDHVLTKTFYLLQSFPGRWADGEVWVEAPRSTAKGGGKAAANDGVSPLIIGSNDWAAAWAVDEHGNPMALLIPDDAEQRELAYRFGVNLVMYALTGNYKTDQVHVPTLLERLGQ